MKDYLGNSYLKMITDHSVLIKKLLYHACPELYIQNDNYETPVMVFCKKDNRKVLRRLIKLSANLCNSDADGLKPIHIAASYNNIGAFHVIDEEDVHCFIFF